MTAQEIDFDEKEALHEHVFTILSLDTCRRCDQLFDAFKEAHFSLEEDDKAVSVLVRKIDCTAEVRSDKQKFVDRLIAHHGYFPRRDNWVQFPIVLYNEKFIGHQNDALTRFYSIVDQYL
jgi:hypothetical protein